MAVGREEGRAEGIEETAICMLKENADVKFIARVTGLSKDDVLKLKNKL